LIASEILIPLSIFTASFLGSWHCAGMCGPLAASAATKNQLMHYNLGRLLSYTILGVVSGVIGRWALFSEMPWVRYIAVIVIAMLLILNGISFLNPQWQKPYKIFEGLLGRLLTPAYRAGFKRSPHSGLLIGALSGLLPCGWLYTFVFAAASTKSPLAGAIVMIIFWLGTLPAVSAAAAIIRKPMLESPKKMQKIAGVILIIAGFYALTAHLLAHNL
jgi:uncharacterized protein